MGNTQQAKKRRLQDTLIIAGDGVIAFSVWSLVKTALFFLLTKDELIREAFSIDESLPMTAVCLAVLVLLCIDLIVRAFVGLSARAEGHGKKKSPFYLVVAALAAIANTTAAITTALGMAVTLSLLDLVISVVIEITALAALVLVIYSSVSLRRLNRSSG